MSKYNPSELLNKAHDRQNFDCGVEALNEHLKKYALQNQKKDLGRTYVVTTGSNRIVGYYTLVYGATTHEEATAEVAAGIGKYQIPIILLARLAVDVGEKGQGLGKALVRDALLRAVQAADIAGLRAVLVHAKGEAAKKFYEKLNFQSSPSNKFHLFVRISDVRKTLLEENRNE